MQASSGIHVMLVEPEIPWNTGNLGRTCLAAGARLHLVEPLGFSLAEREIRRAGLDYWSRVAPRIWPSWDDAERALPDLGEPFLLAPRRGRSILDVTFPSRVVLVLGSESKGLPEETLARHEASLVHLPMRDDALRSLNLSTAGGIALYEILRQHASRLRT